METVQNYSELTLSSLRAMGEKTMSVLPNILGAIILLLLGWLVAKVVAWAVQRLLISMGMNKWSQKLNDANVFNNNELKFDAVKMISSFVYWTVMLIFLITASETLGWNAVSQEIGGLIRYIPRLISAIVILVIGLYIAGVIRKAIYATFSSVGIQGAKGISNLAFYIIAIFLSITAMNQAGINTSIITNNLTIIIGSILLSFAIAFGLGSRELLQNILSGLYSRRTFRVGQKVKIDEITGIIVRMDSLNITVQTDSGKFVIPAYQFLNTRVEILEG